MARKIVAVEVEHAGCVVGFTGSTAECDALECAYGFSTIGQVVTMTMHDADGSIECWRVIRGTFERVSVRHPQSMLEKIIDFTASVLVLSGFVGVCLTFVRAAF